MNNKINSSYPKIGNAEIVRAEKLLGIRLPESVKKFYLENNGGMPECDVYISDGYEYMVNYFMPLILPDGLDDTVIATKRLIDDVSPSWFIPIADDGGELLYGFSTADEEPGAIYCWITDCECNEIPEDYNPDDYMVYLSGNIQDFIEGMIKVED